jgi:hypothetical protein
LAVLAINLIGHALPANMTLLPAHSQTVKKNLQQSSLEFLAYLIDNRP